MNVTQQMWDAAKVAAQRIMDAYPDRGLRGFSGGGGNTDTRFARQGTSVQDSATTLPGLLAALLEATSSQSQPSNLRVGADSALSTILSQSAPAVPNQATLDSAMAVNPTTFEGSPGLSAILNRDPYSISYEADTEDAYRQRAGDALAQLQTGHEAVRGGQNRSALAQGVMAERLAQGRGEEVRKAQVQDAGLVMGSTGLFGQLENARRAQALQAQGQQGTQAQGRQVNTLEATGGVDRGRGAHNASLALASQMLGTKHNVVEDDLTGRGNQGTSSWGVNVLGGCCFIFLESLNGKLPWYVEAARDEFHTPTRRKGYKWMSNWLVPLMQRSKAVRLTVNALIVKPCLVWGEHRYALKGSPVRELLKPYVFGLFHTWWLLGKTIGRRVV